MRDYRASWPEGPGLIDLPHDVVDLEVGSHVYRMPQRLLYLLVAVFLGLSAAAGALTALTVGPAIIR